MNKFKFLILIAAAVALSLFIPQNLSACTGISLTAQDNSFIVGRTMEWGTFQLPSNLIVVPRGYTRNATTPSGNNGLKITNKYGYIGIGVLEDNYLAEGMNEKGMVGQLFYFPGSGKYEKYNEAYNSSTMSEVQLLDWALSNFATIAEMEKELSRIHVVAYGEGFETAHFSIADATGRSVVVEYIDGELHIFENTVGIITNSPRFDWHLTNLNNYVNLYAGMAAPQKLNDKVTLKSLGVGSAALGLPGDLTPPSRFVRAAFYKFTSKPQMTGEKTVLQLFQILNNFDLPIGAEFADKDEIPDFLSATQWTTASDTKALKFYYRTEWNYTIRCIDLTQIDFSKVKYHVLPLDRRSHPIEYITIK